MIRPDTYLTKYQADLVARLVIASHNTAAAVSELAQVLDEHSLRLVAQSTAHAGWHVLHLHHFKHVPSHAEILTYVRDVRA